MADAKENRDIVVQPDSFLFMQNEGKNGQITVHRGLTVVNQTGQDQPIKYNPATHSYQTCTLEQAVQLCPRANEGDYVVLENPTEKCDFPSSSAQPASQNLNKGRRVVIPGPWSEALWPGQSATVIAGHRLRSNQYLVTIVYNSEEAAKNWEKGTIVKQQTEAITPNPDTGDTSIVSKIVDVAPEKLANNIITGLPKPTNLSVGTRIIIRGEDVSYYIPCTGVEVLKDESTGKYVREAVTLEQLEYCCLVDESGKKEYPHGPAVVFPRPTQTFEEDSKKRRKFRPIELNNINGIHLKVTAAFEGPDIENDLSITRKFKEGAELFVTGKTLSIYYPREELAVIEYGQGNKKHYSTAIPKGEGRYVINRQTRDIKTVEGPKMFLADPRTEIPVRRVLGVDDCKLWYPGNQQAIDYNLELAQAMAESPSGRSGTISEGDYRKRQMKSRSNDAYLSAAGSLDTEADLTEALQPEATIRRGSVYSQPRTLTLNTKYDGVPRIEVWPGYAVLVVGSKGERKVVEGPQALLLDYDQKLGFMDLSTGTPKKSDKTVRTAYLCVQNNQVGDLVSFESKDQVKGKIKISLRVSFEAEDDDAKLRWFSVDNYVKFLTDHVRSLIGGMTKKKEISEIKGNYVDLVRDALLGAKTEGQKRLGLSFENGMRVLEVEVLELTLDDANIAKLLDAYQSKVVQSDIELASAKKDLESVKAKEKIAAETAKAVQDTIDFKSNLAFEALEAQQKLAMERHKNDLLLFKEQVAKIKAEQESADAIAAANLARQRDVEDQAIAFEKSKVQLEKERTEVATDAAVKRFEAAKNGLTDTLVALTRDEMAIRLAEATNIERYLTGDSTGSTLSNLLSVAPTLKQFFDRADTAHKVAETNRLKNVVVPAGK